MGNDLNNLSTRARRFRWGLVLAAAAALLWGFADTNTVLVLVLLTGMWISGTFLGFMLDEYWPRKQYGRR